MVGGAWTGARGSGGGGGGEGAGATPTALGAGTLRGRNAGAWVEAITAATATVVMSTPPRIHAKRLASLSSAMPHSKANRRSRRTASLSEMPACSAHHAGQRGFLTPLFYRRTHSRPKSDRRRQSVKLIISSRSASAPVLCLVARCSALTQPSGAGTSDSSSRVVQRRYACRLAILRIDRRGPLKYLAARLSGAACSPITRCRAACFPLHSIMIFIDCAGDRRLEAVP